MSNKRFRTLLDIKLHFFLFWVRNISTSIIGCSKTRFLWIRNDYILKEVDSPQIRAWFIILFSNFFILLNKGTDYTINMPDHTNKLDYAISKTFVVQHFLFIFLSGIIPFVPFLHGSKNLYHQKYAIFQRCNLFKTFTKWIYIKNKAKNLLTATFWVL